MTTLGSLAEDARTPTPPPVPYVALGDSLTQGANSQGVAAISQRRSYLRLIAKILGADLFGQPLPRGYLGRRMMYGWEI
jgi:hypothetical protein